MPRASFFKRIAVIALLLVVAGGTSSLADGADVTLDGDFVQGGLVLGRASPGARVTVDGTAIRVGADGTFLFGFGRDAAEKTTLEISQGGRATTRVLSVQPRTYKIQRIDGLPERKVAPRLPEDLARIKRDAAQIRRARTLDTAAPGFQSGFIWPAKGRISGVFGSQRVLNGKPRRPHNGVDVAAPIGAPVVAMADGVVALAEEGMFFGGHSVMLDHGHGLTSVYIHLDSIAVEKGTKVKQGEKIGTVGKTGRATGPHLHWGVTWFGTHLDPALLVGPMPK